MVIVIDFDGVCVEEEYPYIGRPLPNAVKVINKLYDQGHTIIIWSCREGESLEEAIEALDLHGFKYHHINQNCPERKKRFGGIDSRKVGGDVYIDDKCLPYLLKGIDWLEIDKMLTFVLNKSVHTT